MKVGNPFVGWEDSLHVSLRLSRKRCEPRVQNAHKRHIAQVVQGFDWVARNILWRAHVRVHACLGTVCARVSKCARVRPTET